MNVVIDAVIGLIYNVFMYLFGAHEPLRFNISTTVYEFIHDFTNSGARCPSGIPFCNTNI